MPRDHLCAEDFLARKVEAEPVAKGMGKEIQEAERGHCASGTAITFEMEELQKVEEENEFFQESLFELTNSCQARLASLDVCRGVVVAMMVIVKYAGGFFPAIDYAPWEGINLADFGAPMFLFLVGVSVALAYSNVQYRLSATGNSMLRSTRLFALGVLLEGGFLHTKENLRFGVDVGCLRWFGTLQRISLAYSTVSLCEIWTPSGRMRTKRYLPWIVAMVVSATSLALLYGLYVPDWKFVPSQLHTVGVDNGGKNDGILCTDSGAVTSTPFAYANEATSHHSTNWTSNPRLRFPNATNSTCSGLLSNLTLGGEETLPASTSSVSRVSEAVVVPCGLRGHLGPECNAAGYIDRVLLGLHHLKSTGMSKACNSILTTSSLWCLAPFDPEGLLSSLSAIATSSIGLHLGHVLLQEKQHSARLWSWIQLSGGLLTVGMTLHNLGMPFNRQLYSFSFMCFTAGAASTLFTSIYILVQSCGWTMGLLQRLGRHSLLVFGLVGCDILPMVLQGFYQGSPKNNPISFLRDCVMRIVQFISSY